jgi:myo-inositol-1(or 4)-monophosphatase
LRAPDRDDLQVLKSAVAEAGEIARSFFGQKIKSWDKGKGALVTEADIAVNDLLRSRLTAARPDYGWLSEETEDDAARLKKSRVFVIDPIDGTVSFAKGKPEFVIAAAVVEDGRPAAAAVLNPITNELFEAVKGASAQLNGKAIHPSHRTEIGGCRMLGSKSMFEHPAWPQRWPAMHIETRGSIAYRMCLVAAGRFDAMMALSSKRDWDLAAADLIATEAGARCTTHNGQAFTFNRESTLHPSVVCAGPTLYDALLVRVGHLKLPAASV